MHEQNANTKDTEAHQRLHVPHINAFAVNSNTFPSDDVPVDDDLRQLYMSLVGALAWLILTMPAIRVYVTFLQRHGKAPTTGHVLLASRLLAWTTKQLPWLGLWYRRLRGPL